jgi:DNA-directed RNA polymerase beta subunit
MTEKGTFIVNGKKRVIEVSLNKIPNILINQKLRIRMNSIQMPI